MFLPGLTNATEEDLCEKFYPARAFAVHGEYKGHWLDALRVEYRGKEDFSLHVDGKLAFAGEREAYAKKWIAENLR